MVRSRFVGAIPPTTTNRSCCLYRLMSSCAASCCICSPKVSCASGTSASWPTANVPPPCHFASNCSARHRKPSKRSLPPVRVICGLAPSVVGRCWSSKDLLLLRSSFVLHRPRMPSPHETTIDITKPLRASDRCLSLCLLAQPIPFSRSPRSPFSGTFDFSATLLLPQLNLHIARIRRNPDRLPSNGCIESAQSTLLPFYPSAETRFRYSTNVFSG